VGLDLAKRRAFEAFLAARGYTVAPVTIDNDDYIGISWLHHWEWTAGQTRSASPDPPAWVTAAYQALSR
jgi:hypothetical protein